MTTEDRLMRVATACEAILAVQIAVQKGTPPPSEWFILGAFRGLAELQAVLESELN